MNNLEIAKKNARSLVPGEQVTGLKMIGIEEQSDGVYKYYLEEGNGKYWYQSSGTEQFEKWIREKEKERRRCSKRYSLARRDR